MRFALIPLASLLTLPLACEAPESKVTPTISPVVQPVVVDAPEPTPVHLAEVPAIIEAEEPATPRTLFEEEAIVASGEVSEHRDDARLLLGENKPGEAIESLRRALFLDGGATSWAELGRAYLRADQEDRGLACLEEAVAKNRYLFDDRVEMAQRYLKKGDIDKAREHAGLVAVNRHDDVEANYLAGRIYMKSNMWNEAVASFERVVQLEPDNKFARNNLGYSALQIGEDVIALRHLEETLDLEPTAYMMNNLGIAYERMTQEIDAYAAFLRAVEMKNGYVNAMVNRDRVETALSDEEKQLALDIVEELKSPRVVTAVAAADDESVLGE